jgi:hypothetical protein
MAHETEENVMCTWEYLDEFLRSMLGYPESQVLEFCNRSDSRMPGLYEFLVTMLGTPALADREYAEKTGRTPLSARGLEKLVKRAQKAEGGFVVPARCNLPSCKYHSEERLLFYPRPSRLSE